MFQKQESKKKFYFAGDQLEHFFSPPGVREKKTLAWSGHRSSKTWKITNKQFKEQAAKCDLSVNLVHTQIQKRHSARNKCEAAVIRRLRKQLSTLTGFQSTSCFRICKLMVGELSWYSKMICLSKAYFKLATEFSQISTI